MSLCNLMVLLFAFLVVYLRFHVSTLHLCLHLLYAGLKSTQFVLQLANLFQFLVTLLFQFLNYLEFLTDVVLWLFNLSEFCLQTSYLPILVLPESIHCLLQLFFLLGNVDYPAAQSLQLIISSQDLLFHCLLSILIFTGLEVHELPEFTNLLFQELVVVVLNLCVFKERATCHQHETFFVLQLLLKVTLERVNTHAHFQNFSIEFRGDYIVTLLQFIPLRIGQLNHLSQFVVFRLQSSIAFKSIIKAQLVELFHFLEVCLVKCRDLYFEKLNFLLESNRLILQFLFQKLALLLSCLLLGSVGNLFQFHLLLQLSHFCIFMPDELEDVGVFGVKHLLKLLPVVLLHFCCLCDQFVEVSLQVFILLVLFSNSQLVSPFYLFSFLMKFLQEFLSFSFAFCCGVSQFIELSALVLQYLVDVGQLTRAIILDLPDFLFLLAHHFPHLFLQFLFQVAYLCIFLANQQLHFLFEGFLLLLMGFTLSLQLNLQFFMLDCLLRQLFFQFAQLKLVNFDLCVFFLAEGTHLQKVALLISLLYSCQLMSLLLRRFKQQPSQICNFEQQCFDFPPMLFFLDDAGPGSHKWVDWGSHKRALVSATESAIFLIGGASEGGGLIERRTVVGSGRFSRGDCVD